MQVTLQQPAMKYLLDSSVDFFVDLMGYSPQKTNLEVVSENNWRAFSFQRGLNPSSSGVYLPRNQTAFIRGENPLSLFHEYFGHGLYFEQTLPGRQFIDLEKKLLQEEEAEFKGRKFTLEEVNSFRKENDTFQKLEQFRKSNFNECELFAIWTEYVLSTNSGLIKSFEDKYRNLISDAIGPIVDFAKQYGELATFYEFDLARNTTTPRVKRLLEDIYGEPAITGSKLILLSGSKKPFSDIDLFASSESLVNTKNNWLDLVVFDEIDFERRVALFESQVTHPIMAGELVAGENRYLEEKRLQLKEQPITEKAIRHNLVKSKQAKIASEETKDKVLKRGYYSYYQTYLANALALKNGLRLFTKEALLEYFNELKGGKQ